MRKVVDSNLPTKLKYYRPRAHHPHMISKTIYTVPAKSLRSLAMENFCIIHQTHLMKMRLLMS